jgi:hypothetical protein
VRAGKFAAEMSLTPNDPVSYRTELVVNGSANPLARKLEWGKEYFIRFSNRLADWAPDPVTLEEIIFQLHGAPLDSSDWGPCPEGSLPSGVKQWMFNNLITIRTEHTDARLSVQGTGSTAPNKGSSFELGTLPLQQWTDWSLHFKLSTGSDGFIKMWRGSQLVVSHTGDNVDAFDACGREYAKHHYLKIGIYKSAWRNEPSDWEPRVINYDEVEIWGK